MPSQSRAKHKRQQFLESAAQVIHQRGFARTTLGQIAAHAQLPQGSLYYYFRSKEDVVAAIVAERLRELEQRVADWDTAGDPKARLRQLIQVWIQDAETDARYGCPLGSLCYELAKLYPPGRNPASEPLAVLLAWCTAQFRELGAEPGRAADQALHLLSALQGISLIANAFQDPDMILRETAHLQDWLAGL